MLGCVGRAPTLVALAMTVLIGACAEDQPEAGPTVTPTVVADETGTGGEHTWEGLMVSRGTCCPNAPDNPGSEVWETTLRLTVDADGDVRGTGDARATKPATYQVQPNIPPCTRFDLDIEGSFTDVRGFAIRIFPQEAVAASCLQAGFFANWLRGTRIDPPTQNVPLTGPGVASGKVTVSESAGLVPGTSRNTFRLECTSGC
jgi:hypothetical protein